MNHLETSCVGGQELHNVMRYNEGDMGAQTRTT